MQSLVFAPRCYYFEIGTISPLLYILQKNTKEGTVTARKKNYVLQYASDMKELIDDLCYVFLDDFINLRPIAHLSSLCMCNRNYKDFLSPPPPGRGIKLQIHCWHIFVPEYHNSSKGPVPDEYREEIDKEQAVKVPEYQANEIPDLTSDDLDSSILEVTEYNVKEDVNKFEDSSYCHTHRNEFGTPSDLTENNILHLCSRRPKLKMTESYWEMSLDYSTSGVFFQRQQTQEETYSRTARNQPTGGN